MDLRDATMSVPTWAGFVAYIPDDEVATGYEIAVYGGRNVAVGVGEVFADLGCSHIAVPQYGGEVGWDFRFRYGGRHSFWCRVQSFHPIYWLLLEGPSGKRGVTVHGELWRRFADALQQDSRFAQVLWRTSKEGPPDWNEFTITDDLPPRIILDELPELPAKPRPKAAGGSLAPLIIGAWFASAIGVMTLIDHTIHSAKAQAEVRPLSVAALLIGLAIVLRMTDRHRKRGLRGAGEDMDSTP
jgi:hypothetical protein